MLKALTIKIDTFLDFVTPSRRGSTTGYLLASVLVLIALLVRLAIAPTEAGLPFLTFFPAVMLAAILGGFGPGLFALIICSILASYLFIPPFNTFPLTFNSEVIGSNIVFYVEEITVIIVVQAMYRQHSRYVNAAGLVERLNAAQQTLHIAATAFETQESIMVTDSNKVILRINQAFTRIYGYDLEEVVGTIPSILQADHYDENFFKAMWANILHDRYWAGEICDKRKNGELFPAWLTVSSVTDKDGSVTHYVCTLSDITEYRIAEDKLRLMQRAIDSSSNGIVITGTADNDHNIIYANNAFLNMTGYSMNELLGQNCRILQKNDRDQTDLEKIRAALIQDVEGCAILRNYRKDGSLFWNEIYVSPIRDNQNKITHYLGVQNDVTQRYEMEASLRAGEERYRALFDNSLEAILINRGGNKIERVNQACLRLWRAGKPEDLLGKQPLELMHPDCHAIIKERINDMRLHGVAQPIIEEKIIRLDGTVADVLVSAIPFEDEQGPLIFVTLLDITERKQAEAALWDSQSKYKELSSHLELVREEERTRIAREIHDEVGSFLTVLNMDLNWLNKQLPKELATCREITLEMMQQTQDGIKTVKRIITDLRPSILDNLGLLPAIEWLVENFRQRTGINCIVTAPEEDLIIDSHISTAVFRIAQETLMNILSHAQASEVKVSIELREKNLLMTIYDNGCGIAQAKNIAANGYGIPGMMERAHHFGGQLTIESQPRAGTTISLNIPLLATELEKNDD